MNLFEVYPLWDIKLAKAQGCYVYDEQGQEYLDFYGGHAVISIGHSHPHYVKALTEQVQRIGFYSNSIKNELQEKVAEKLGQLSGYPDYALFFCNSGAEANENALKVASFHTGKKKVLAFKKSFHGRTSGAVSATDNPVLSAPFNESANVNFVALNDVAATEAALKSEEYAAVIIEGIQGVAGIFMPTNEFLQQLRALCTKYNTVLILDEIQSGYGRTGNFFAHQWAGIRPDIITTAKGMGNGFPIGGVLITPEIKPSYGMLGTTFGGNHLACAAALAVLETIEKECLTANAQTIGIYIAEKLHRISGITVRGRGLMIGVEMPYPVSKIRQQLLFEHHIFTGSAGANIIRLLPPLCINKKESDIFLNIFQNLIK